MHRACGGNRAVPAKGPGKTFVKRAEKELMTTSPHLSLETFIEESDEPLWLWEVPSDRLYLSMGAKRRLGLSRADAPARMDDYLTHLPPAEQDAVRHALEESLSSREQHFSLLHFFDRMQVLEHAGVLRRGEDGRPTHVLGNMEIAEKGKELVPVAGYMAAFLPEGSIRFDRNCAILLGRERPAPFSAPLEESLELVHANERERLAELKLVCAPGSSRDQFEDILLFHREDGACTRLKVSISVLKRDHEGRAALLAGNLQPAVCGATGSGSLLTLAVHSTGDGLWDWDATNDTVYYSPQYLSMLGYTEDTFPATLETWARKIHPDDYARTFPIQQAIVESPRNGNSFEVTYRLKKADGTWAWILGRGHVTHRDENGRATRLIGMHTDISTAQLGREKLEDMVRRDILTGLCSRAFLEMRLEELNARPVWPLSIISCDVNGLKLINDHLGHAAGDEVLVQGATLLRRSMRLSDCVARMGGDEFVALLPGCSAAQARRIAGDIVYGLEACNSDESRIPVLLSLGMATSENGDVPPGELIKRADRAMLEQKAKSRAASHRHIKDWIEQRHHIAVSLEDIRYAGPCSG